MQNRIGDARRDYSLKHGKFTQNDAADFFGVSLSTYKKWEQGQGMMNGEQLRNIAMKYEVTTDFLLCRDDSAAIEYSSQRLSCDEIEMINIMRKISQHGRDQLLIFARGVAQTYPKNHQLSASKTA